MHRQTRLFPLLIMSVSATVIVPFYAKASNIRQYAGNLETHARDDYVFDIFEAKASIIAQVCTEETSSEEGVAFEACCQSVPLAFTPNFLQLGANQSLDIEEKLRAEGQLSEEFLGCIRRSSPCELHVVRLQSSSIDMLKVSGKRCWLRTSATRHASRQISLQSFGPRLDGAATNTLRRIPQRN
jgi:hypothetical protein